MDTLSRYAETGRLPEGVPFRLMLGPVSDPPQREEAAAIETEEFLRACVIESKRVGFYGRVSSSFECASRVFGPGTTLAAAAPLLLALVESGAVPNAVVASPKPNLPEAAKEPYFQEDTFVHGHLYPEGFTGENICRYCRLQSWSVKPAVP